MITIKASLQHHFVLGMLRTLIDLTTLLSLLHAKPLTNHTQLATKGWEFQGQLYSVGERFNEGTDGQGCCHGLYCSHNDDVVPWDNINCGTTSSPTTTQLTKPKSTTPGTNSPSPTSPKSTTPVTNTPSSTLPKSTTPGTNTPPPTFSPLTITARPFGCKVDGSFYNPGEVIEKWFDAELKWCYGANCTDDGVIVFWDNFDCTPTTTEQPTTFQSTTTPNNDIPDTTKHPRISPIPTHTGNFSTLEARSCSRIYHGDNGLIITSDSTPPNSSNKNPETMAPVYYLLLSTIFSRVLVMTRAN